MKRNFTISGLFLLCFFIINNALAQNITVKGKVTDAATGETLPGVTVILKGTSIGSQTDGTGLYSIKAPANGTLTFSYLGYVEQSVAVNGQSTIDIKLAAKNNELQQVVVVGYGSQRKIDVTGSVATIRGSDLAKQPDANPISALQGKVAGVQITNSGTPGSSPTITIRGIGTVYGSLSPLYVVDGVWMNNIDFLNSNDIESMSILKDASSEAIYGIQAANGVIIITTKKGKGAATVQYNGYAGITTIERIPKVLDATDYVEAVNELSTYNGGKIDPAFSNPASFGEGTNWFNVILRNAFTQSHNISVSGSSEKSTYNFSAGFLQQDGNIAYQSYNRITTHMQQDVQAYKFLKLGYSASLSGDLSHDVPGDIMYKAYTAAPVVPVRYSNGTYGDPADYPIGLTTNNPQAELDFFHQHTKNYRLNGTAYADLAFTSYLTFHTDFGGEYDDQDIDNYTPLYYATTNQKNQDNSVLVLTNGKVRNWIWENYLKFDKDIAKDHHVDLLVGTSALRNRGYSESGTALDVPDIPYNNYLSLGDPSTTKVTDGGSLSTQSSYFARLQYAYKDRYALNASIRRDGTSQLSEQYRFITAPSIGVAWNISNEDFMKGQQIFSSLKLRGSWGKLANASVPDNITQLTINNGFESDLGGQNQLQQGKGITVLVPSSTYYESEVETNVGIESAFLNNKLTFNVDYYNRKTENAIFDAPILGSLGLTSVNGGQSILANQADFGNKGFEFELGWRGNSGNDFSYDINANFSINTNGVSNVKSGKVPIYGGGGATTGGAFATRTVVGGPIGEFYGYKVLGVFQNQAQINNSKQPNAKPGDFIFQDTNNDGVISGTDRVDLGNPNPKFLYGVNTDFKYKQFTLSLDLQGVAKVSIYDAIDGLRYGAENFTQNFFDSRWHGEGTSNTNPSVNVGSTANNVPNSWFVRDGSYFRIRNLQLGYILPNTIMSRIGVKSIKVYASAQNLATFTKYKGFTPEIGGDPINNGIDNAIVPVYSTFVAGLNVTF